MLEKIQQKHLLIDSDIIKYRCAAAAEKTKYLVEYADNFTDFDSYNEAKKFLGDRLGYIWSRKELQPIGFALRAVDAAIDTIKTKLNPVSVSYYLSPASTFRDNIAKTKPYKGNRNQVKPKYLREVEEYLVEDYGAVYGDNVEADDLIGINLSKLRDDAVSVSIDKDLYQISGWHFDWVNDRLRRISPRDADFNFYTQLLTGDITDNVPGIDGIGPKRAAELLGGAKSKKELASRVWSVYRDRIDDPEQARSYFLEQAALLWILRESERGKGWEKPEGFEFD
jgi:hypothetical protein